MSYVAPRIQAKLDAAAIQEDPSKVLTAANFPSLGATVRPTTQQPLEFLKRLKESEEERRRREEEAAAADPNGILGKSPEALNAMGWTVLSLSAPELRASWKRQCDWKPPADTL